MADNTDVNVTENNRQSKDYPQNFNAENRSDDTEVLHSPKAECVISENAVPTTEDSTLYDNEVFHPPGSECVTSVPVTDASISDDSSFKCWCPEIFSPNQRLMTCGARWSERTDDDVLPERKTSRSSINSTDSGYASRKCTGIFPIPEID